MINGSRVLFSAYLGLSFFKQVSTATCDALLSLLQNSPILQGQARATWGSSEAAAPAQSHLGAVPLGFQMTDMKLMCLPPAASGAGTGLSWKPAERSLCPKLLGTVQLPQGTWGFNVSHSHLSTQASIPFSLSFGDGGEKMNSRLIFFFSDLSPQCSRKLRNMPLVLQTI